MATPQTQLLAQALASAFPTLRFEREPATGIVHVYAGALRVSIVASQEQPLLEAMQAPKTEQPLGASSEPAYTSPDKTSVPVMSHPITHAQ